MVARLSPAASETRPASDDNSLSVGYGQWTAQFKGRQTPVVLLLTLLVCGQLWFAWEVLRRVEAQHAALLSEVQIQTWLLAQPDASRPKLAMPSALRQRLAQP